MNQTGNTIHPGNIQHFADSAKNALRLGQRQFYTPPPLAAALCSVLRNNVATIAADLSCGSGYLLNAAKRRHSLGIDVDSRVTSLGDAVPNSALYQADVTRFYPLAHQARMNFDLLLLNPPFSLQWYLDRLAPLAVSTALGVAETYAAACAAGDTIDSTLGTLLIALDLLSTYGEGFMICNAATARRLIGNPEEIGDRGSEIEDEEHFESGRPSSSPIPDLRSPISSLLLSNIWAWLEIPGAVFEGQHTQFDTAVLYFSASHGKACPADRKPLMLHAPSADPGTVEKTLQTAISARPFAFCGRSLTHDYQAIKWQETMKPRWEAARHEYHQLYHGAPPEYNLMLGPDGRIRAFLDPFRRAAYIHNSDLLMAFKSMAGESPAALVIQQASRCALKHAITSGVWRVDPALVAAVDQAIANYEAIRAPFYTPNEVQALGWLDEESQIPCAKPGIPGFRPGQTYPLKTWIEATEWSATKMNLEGHQEQLNLSGRELVVELIADDESSHRFHVRRDDADDPDAATAAFHYDPSDKIHHHHIQSLINHFAIPIPRDVAQANPETYQQNLRRLARLEALINAA